jgi:hypothetical protein
MSHYYCYKYFKYKLSRSNSLLSRSSVIILFTSLELSILHICFPIYNIYSSIYFCSLGYFREFFIIVSSLAYTKYFYRLIFLVVV